MSEDGKKGGKIAGKLVYELGLGIHGLSKEEMIENARKGGQKGGKTTASQKWKCTITGYVCNSGGLSCYQKKRGIDTSNRIRIQ
jgi:hypothetical protein